MFESLSDRIKQDEQAGRSRTERLIRWVLVLILSALLFGGLYFAVRMWG